MDGPIVDGNGRATGPIAFIDRDGVLNYGRNGYVNHPEELKIIPGSGSAIARLRERLCHLRCNKSIPNHA